MGTCGWVQWGKGRGPSSNLTRTRESVWWASAGITAATKDLAFLLVFVNAQNNPQNCLLQVVYLWLVKILQINRTSAVWFGTAMLWDSQLLDSFNTVCLQESCGHRLWDVCTFNEGLALELVLVCNKTEGCWSSSDTQEAHCLNSGLSCIFCIIASTKEKEKYLCRVTEASRVVIFIAYICSTSLALSLNYYGWFAFFFQSLLLRRPVGMTVLQTRRQ